MPRKLKIQMFFIKEGFLAESIRNKNKKITYFNSIYGQQSFQKCVAHP